MVNLSDVRPVPLSTLAAMRMAWNSQEFQGDTAVNEQRFFRDFSVRQHPSPFLVWVFFVEISFLPDPSRDTARRNWPQRTRPIFPFPISLFFKNFKKSIICMRVRGIFYF